MASAEDPLCTKPRSQYVDHAIHCFDVGMVQSVLQGLPEELIDYYYYFVIYDHPDFNIGLRFSPWTAAEPKGIIAGLAERQSASPQCSGSASGGLQKVGCHGIMLSSALVP